MMWIKRLFAAGLVLPLLGMVLGGCGTTEAVEDVVEESVEIERVPDTENEFTPEAMSGLDAQAYFQEEGLRVGWNLGNSLDAHRGGVSGEAVWGNPRVTRKIFDGVKKAGYDVVRIPITWMGHIGKAPDYHIDPAFLQRAAEVVGYAREAGFAVIINLHHDGATESGGKDLGWLSINTARRSEEGMREVTAKFERVWTQVAKYFKNYGAYLMFESMNEIHDGNWGWGREQDQRPQYEIVNRWNQVFVNAVRGTGGNNAARFLVIPGYGTVPRHTTADYFHLPEDVKPADSGAAVNDVNMNKLIVTVHYYDPYEFCIAGTRHVWGSDADKAKVEQDFRAVAGRFVPAGIPVIIGESGAVQQKDGQAARLEYIDYVYRKAREAGLVPLYWDNGAVNSGGENFGLFNRNTGEPFSEETGAVIKTMINAVR